jgi:hypothetical protein
MRAPAQITETSSYIPISFSMIVHLPSANFNVHVPPPTFHSPATLSVYIGTTVKPSNPSHRHTSPSPPVQLNSTEHGRSLFARRKPSSGVEELHLSNSVKRRNGEEPVRLTASVDAPLIMRDIQRAGANIVGGLMYWTCPGF